MERIMNPNIDEFCTRRPRAARWLITAFVVAAAAFVVACDDDDSLNCTSNDDCSGACIDGTCVSNQDATDDGDTSDGTDDGDTTGTPECGDGTCNGTETVSTCYEDCGECGDAICTSGEEDATSCAADCADCGDDVCDTNETLASCFQDCGECGDDICTEGEEDDVSCYDDCGECGDLICQAEEGEGLPDACDQDCAVTAFRSSSLSVLQPAIFIGDSPSACSEITDTANLIFNGVVTQDGDDDDNFYDLSLVQLFRPYTASAPAGTRIDFGAADCTADETPSQCSPQDDGSGGTAAPVVVSYSSQTTGSCADPLPGTVPAEATPPAAPCFATESSSVTISLLGLSLTLESALVAGTFVGDGTPDSISNGIIGGFLTLDAARALVFPDETPLVGGQKFAEILDGPDSCQGGIIADDLDKGPNGNPGWWFYLSTSGDSVAWNGE